MICNFCGKTIYDTVTFCPYCKKKIFENDRTELIVNDDKTELIESDATESLTSSSQSDITQSIVQSYVNSDETELLFSENSVKRQEITESEPVILKYKEHILDEANVREEYKRKQKQEKKSKVVTAVFSVVLTAILITLILSLVLFMRNQENKMNIIEAPVIEKSFEPER